MLERYYNWRNRLYKYIAKRARRGFKPGEHDCALFVAGAVREITGKDFARGLRGYRTIEEGYAKLAEKGFDSLPEYVASIFEEIPIARARPGDVAVLEDEHGEEVLGLVQGGKIYVLHVRGLATVRLTDAKRIFQV